MKEKITLNIDVIDKPNYNFPLPNILVYNECLTTTKPFAPFIF